MVWKQDLAKLKQQLKEDEPKATPPKPASKPAPKPAAPGDMDSEDALFLLAMGKRPARPAPSLESEPAAPAVPPPPPPPATTFHEALGDLKGLKPMPRPALLQTAAAPAPGPGAEKPLEPPTPTPIPAPIPEPPAPPPPPPAPAESVAPGTPAPPAHPVRFQLAAGMALDVDGILDLRGHSRADAVERLKDRLADGVLLGWRSLQVILGADAGLHEGLVDLLNSGDVPMVSRYAQAPVPMGGNQAWLLYFGPGL